MALYLTPAELVAFIRESESLDQSNEDVDLFVDESYYGKAIETASGELDARLGMRYPLPLPMSPQVKALCYPIAHWWAEKGGSKREYVQVEYEAAVKLLDAIAAGTAALVGLNGKPIGAIGGDSSGEAGMQSVGTYIGKRTVEWAP